MMLLKRAIVSGICACLQQTDIDPVEYCLLLRSCYELMKEWGLKEVLVPIRDGGRNRRFLLSEVKESIRELEKRISK